MTKAELTKIINEAIDFFDPYGLLELGAPSDEYSGEARFIEEEFSKNKESLEKIIAEVFLSQFTEPLAEEVVVAIAERIRSNLNK